MSTAFLASKDEETLVAQIFAVAGCPYPGVIGGDVLVKIFTASADLTPLVLSQIWNIADEDKTGNLTVRELAIAIRLIGWAQNGESVDARLVNLSGPLPHIVGISAGGKKGVGCPPSDAVEMIPEPFDWPPLTEHCKNQAEKLFNESQPINGLVDGYKVRDTLLRTNLLPRDLWKIWNIADTQNRGALNLNEFILVMYFVHNSASGKLPLIPFSIPPNVRAHISGKEEGQIPSSTILTVRPSESDGNFARDATTSPQPQKETPPCFPEPVVFSGWDVTPGEKSDADQEFDLLDPERQGYVEGDKLAKFLLKFKLSAEDLAHIWDLADVKNENRFTRDEFAVVIHLIRRRLSGFELPFVLPPTLVPPSMRQKPSYANLSHPLPDQKPGSSRVSKTRSTGIPYRPPPLPPKPTENQRSRATTMNSTSRIPESYAKVKRVTSEQSLSNVSSIPVNQYQESERERKLLALQVTELKQRLVAQRDFQAENVTLEQKNLCLGEKICDMEQTISQLLRATEQLSEVTQEKAKLASQLADFEKTRLQLADTQIRLDTSIRENRELSTRLYDARESAEAAAARAAQEAVNFAEKIEHLEQENEDFRQRVEVMERTISQSEPPPGSETSIQELQILFADVTRENERLKWHLRKMERSRAQMLISSSTAESASDDLRRENLRLSAQVQELENLTRQLQSSSEDGELQRVLKDVTQENDALKATVRAMRDEASRSMTAAMSSTEMQDLERELAGLRDEVTRLQRLQMQAQSRRATPQLLEEDDVDRSIPPPAYDDGVADGATS